MKFLTNFLLIASATNILAACTFGNGMICGPQTPLYYCDKEAYDKLMNSKPYGEHWSKPDVTLQQRREDSWTCGAAHTEHGADYVVFTGEQERAEKRADEKDGFAARSRLSTAWVSCMKRKGYVYSE